MVKTAEDKMKKIVKCRWCQKKYNEEEGLYDHEDMFCSRQCKNEYSWEWEMSEEKEN